MNNLTPHQRDILVAMLQGKQIERDRGVAYSTQIREWMVCTQEDVLHELLFSPKQLRIAPNQGEAVRLYGNFYEQYKFKFGFDKRKENTHYIDISPNAVIMKAKDGQYPLIESLIANYIFMKAECERLRVNDARYQWLRMKGSEVRQGIVASGFAHEIDKRIDAQLAKEQPT